jgi:hypothetical protein
MTEPFADPRTVRQFGGLGAHLRDPASGARFFLAVPAWECALWLASLLGGWRPEGTSAGPVAALWRGPQGDSGCYVPPTGQRLTRDDARAFGVALGAVIAQRAADPVGWIERVDVIEGPLDRRLLQWPGGFVRLRREVDAAPGGPEVFAALATWLAAIEGDLVLHGGWGEAESDLARWPTYLRDQVGALRALTRSGR